MIQRSDSSDSWNNALVSCDIEGGLLASIHSDVENQVAHDFALGAHDNLWIGFTEEVDPSYSAALGMMIILY